MLNLTRVRDEPMKTLSAFDPFLELYYVDDGDLTSSFQRIKMEG